MKSIAKNYKKYLKYYLGYYIVAVMSFLMFDSTTESMVQRIMIAAIVSVFCIAGAKLLSIFMSKHRKKVTWEKMKKTLNLQLSFFLIFGLIGFLISLTSMLLQPSNIPMSLFFSCVPLGLILTIRKLKNEYFYTEK